NPREDRILRFDYNVASRTTAYVRLVQDYAGNHGNGTTVGPTGGGWGQLPSFFDAPSVGAAATVIHTFRPNLVNSFTWGISYGGETAGALDQAQYATNMLPALRGANGDSVTLPSAMPGANVLNLIPKIAFTANGAQSAGQGVTNA